MKKIAALLLAVAASACATTQAKAPPERPVLEVPPVPARVIEPVPLPPPPIVPEPVGDLPAVSPTSGKPRPQPPRDTTKPADPKVETPPVDPAVPPVSPPPVQPVVPPLRTPNTPEGGEATRLIREINDRALKMLNTLDYQKLSNERKAQWQNAKLLITQAEDAIKAANFEFAKNLAEKAERLAKELQGG